MRLIVLLILFPIIIKSQVALELFGGNNFIIHNSNFKKVNNFPNCCTLFKSGTGMSQEIGIGLRYFISTSGSLNFNISNISSLATFSENEKDVFSNFDGSYVDGVYSHNVKINYNYLSFKTSYLYDLNKNTTVLFGIYADYVNSITFSQYEKIVEPSDRVVFVDTKTRIRNEFEGSLENNVKIGLSPALEYKVPLNKKNNLFLSGTIAFKIDLNSSFKEINSTENSINTHLKLLYFLN